MGIVYKIIKYILLLLASMFILVMLFCYLVASGVGETEVYQQSDFFSYHFLTDEEIGGAPRISDNYFFEYHNGDGYPSSNTIVFRQSASLTPLREYLTTLGYRYEPARSGRDSGEVWLRPDAPGDMFSLWYNRQENEVTLCKTFG
ncbi:hypothetical protein FJU30_14365 [Affinibrenneria salicis]|uniref:Uncharacterized protein n=1 Tax=Affinibrenneria salicis TaxID=2590031 RepID=A0A5J5FYN1_9GAMM|nr:hypothetical protein [Affinibrenneria salicis]KAA8998870.1 hypothetical protein FJU30_14365 [Affinibrenneria salicis]